MSQSTIASRKSSPCCIGCVVALVIVIGLFAALGIYMYRFAKENISLIDVATKPDPALTTEPGVLMPETVGDFRRTTLTDSVEHLPTKYWGDIDTTGVQVAFYEDDQANRVTVIAMSSDEARQQRQVGMGPLMTGRGKAGSPDTGFSIRDPFSGDVPENIIVWQKPNWTFVVQTSSTQAMQFVDEFMPGSGSGGAVDTMTTDPATPSEAAPEPSVPPASSAESGQAEPAPVETTPVPASTSGETPTTVPAQI